MNRRFPAAAVVASVLLTTRVPAAQNRASASLPYVAVHDPEFIRASDATFMTDEDRVIGIIAGPMAKAFPAGILSQHGLVQDQSPQGPIAITW